MFEKSPDWYHRLFEAMVQYETERRKNGWPLPPVRLRWLGLPSDIADSRHLALAHAPDADR